MNNTRFLISGLIALCLLAGCSSFPDRPPARPFQFHSDRLAFTNELFWEYTFHPDGRTTTRPKEPAPTYGQRCFPLAQSVRRFFYHAAFEPTLPKLSEAEYHKLVKKIYDRSSRKVSEEKVVITGFEDLFEFSLAHEQLIKKHTGGRWRSYLQRGNWRMIFPFSRNHQHKTAQNLKKKTEGNFLAVVHLVLFPSLAMNHSVMVYDSLESPEAIHFQFYDPNDPSKPGVLTFNKEKRAFSVSQSLEFRGGMVNVYEVYKNCLY